MKYTKTIVKDAWRVYSLIDIKNSLDRTRANRVASAFFKFLSSAIPGRKKFIKDELLELLDEFSKEVITYYSQQLPAVARFYNSTGKEADWRSIAKEEYNFFKKHFLKAIDKYLEE